MTQILRKDPIVEAVCEFRLHAPDWDWTVPGVVYNRIKDRFPRKAEAPQIDFQIEETDEGVHSSAQKNVGRMQFWAGDNTQWRCCMNGRGCAKRLLFDV